VASPAPLLGWDRDGISVELPSLGTTRVGLRGRHQAANVAVAHATLDNLEAAGIARVPDDARRRGYAGARWPGRLELVEVEGPTGRREVLLDGAHNPAGATALAQALDDLRPHMAGGDERTAPPFTVVVGVMADKDVDGIVTALAGSVSLHGARIICTRPDLPRAMEPQALAGRWTRLAPTTVPEAEPEIEAALDRALETAPGPIVVAGSLYLVGAARARLIEDPELLDPTQPTEGPTQMRGEPVR